MISRILGIKYLGNILIILKNLFKYLFIIGSILFISGFMLGFIYFLGLLRTNLGASILITWYTCYLFLWVFSFIFINEDDFGFVNWVNESVGNYDWEDNKLVALLISLSFFFWVIPLYIYKGLKVIVESSEKERKEVLENIKVQSFSEINSKNKAGRLSKYE